MKYDGIIAANMILPNDNYSIKRVNRSTLVFEFIHKQNFFLLPECLLE